MFDSIIATLPCGGEEGQPRVGEIQTTIRGSAADGSTLELGYEFAAARLTAESLERNGYSLIREPAVGEPIRVLDVWSCIGCATEQWVVVVIAGRRLREVRAVELDRATLAAAHYIDAVSGGLALGGREE